MRVRRERASALSLAALCAGLATSARVARALVILQPETDAGNYDHVTAGFGPALPAAGIFGSVFEAEPNDGCDTLVNGDLVKNKIALIYRGNCDFHIKVRNAQIAGAAAVIVANTVATNDLVTMSANGDDEDIVVPSVFVSQSTARAIKNAYAVLNATGEFEPEEDQDPSIDAIVGGTNELVSPWRSDRGVYGGEVALQVLLDPLQGMTTVTDSHYSQHVPGKPCTSLDGPNCLAIQEQMSTIQIGKGAALDGGMAGLLSQNKDLIKTLNAKLKTFTEGGGMDQASADGGTRVLTALLEALQGDVAEEAPIIDRQGLTVGSFKVDSNPRTYAASVQYCESLGMQIASIHNQDESDVVKSLVKIPSYIGATESSTNGQFFWDDGTTWDYAEPHNDGLNNPAETRITVVVGDPGGSWQDWGSGSSALGVVCRSNKPPAEDKVPIPPCEDKLDHKHGAGYCTRLIEAGHLSCHKSPYLRPPGPQGLPPHQPPVPV